MAGITLGAPEELHCLSLQMRNVGSHIVNLRNRTHEDYPLRVIARGDEAYADIRVPPNVTQLTRIGLYVDEKLLGRVIKVQPHRRNVWHVVMGSRQIAENGSFIDETADDLRNLHAPDSTVLGHLTHLIPRPALRRRAAAAR